MALTLDPRFPIVWRSPHSLQVGIDHPRVVIEPAAPAHEQIVSALSAGVSASGLEMIARTGGVGDDELTRLLERLRPFLTMGRRGSRARVVISGTGPTRERIGKHLAAARVQVDGPGQPDLAVVIGHYVIEPERHGRWLRRDVPHLPIVWGDRSVRIGPMVEPGLGACLYCAELHAADADLAWPAIAAQLLGRPAHSESGLACDEVAALASRLLLERLDSGEPLATGYELEVSTGRVQSIVVARHPGCGCGSLDLSSAQPGIVTATGPPRDPRRSSPTIAPDDDAPG